eukprot:6006342-Pyramimonas_sp.AAC.1
MHLDCQITETIARWKSASRYQRCRRMISPQSNRARARPHVEHELEPGCKGLRGAGTCDAARAAGWI